VRDNSSIQSIFVYLSNRDKEINKSMCWTYCMFWT